MVAALPTRIAPLLLAPLTVAALAVGLSPAASAADPLSGTRSITTARGSVAPECLSVDSAGRVTVAALCFKEGGEDHSWALKGVSPSESATPWAYVLRQGDDCLTYDPTRAPNLGGTACTGDRAGQLWRIVERGPGEYQIAHGTACVQARAGEVTTAPCVRGYDALGNDDSGQAWKILKDPTSVVPDPRLGKAPGRAAN